MLSGKLRKGGRMTKTPKKMIVKRKAAAKKTPLPQLPDGMTYATEYEIKQWIIREFRMMQHDTEVSDIELQRYPLRIPNWRLLRVSGGGELVQRFMFEGPHEKLQNGLYLVDKKPT
jgi:hypothetical protein